MFYDNLKAACAMQGLKVSPIVKECGGQVGSIDGWKKGAFPNSNIVIKLSLRLNVSTDYLLGIDEVPNRKKITNVSNLTDIEQRMLTAFRNLTPDDKLIEVGRIEGITEKYADSKVCGGICHDMTEMMPAKDNFMQPSAIENIDTK